MSPTHTRRGNKIYRYYVSQSATKTGPEDCPVQRLPAGEVESAVIDQLRSLLRSPEVVVATWRATRKHTKDLRESDVREALERLDPLWDELFPAEQARIVQMLVERVDVAVDGLDIRLRVDGFRHLAAELDAERLGETRSGMTVQVADRVDKAGATLKIRVPLTIRKRGGRKRVIAPPQAKPVQGRAPDSGDRLLTAIARAYRWQRLFEGGSYQSIGELAKAEGVDRSYAGKVMRLMLLAPDLVEAILDGTEPKTLALARLLVPFPNDWKKLRAE